MREKALLVAIGGRDGAGKTTAIYNIKDILEKMGFKVDAVRDPYDSSIGEKVAKIIENSNLTPDAYMHIFLGNRSLLIKEKVLNSNFDIVLFDRFYESTYVYNARDEKTKKIVKLSEEIALNNIEPVYIIFDLDDSTAKDRLNKRGKDLSHWEKLSDVAKRYREFIKTFPAKGKVYKVDAKESEENLAQTVTEIILKEFKINKQE